MRHDTVFGMLVAIALGTLSLHAEVVPGKWQELQAQPVGTALNVELNSGERVLGDLVQGDSTALMVKTTDQERRIDASEVKKISLSGVKDSSWDGAAVGAALGALGGVILGARAGANDDLNSTAVPIAGGVVLGTGIGFGAGLAADAASQGEETIYRAKLQLREEGLP